MNPPRASAGPPAPNPAVRALAPWAPWARWARLPLLAALGIWALGPAACRPAPSVTVHLRLTQVRPGNQAGVYLNERLVLHFSEPLDPTSVSSRSVRIASEDGRPARGSLTVTGNKLLFEPAPPLTPSLEDGGFRPDTTYEVILAGFPEPDGLRGRSGAMLARGLRFSFHTVVVPPRGEPRSEYVFEDASPGLDRPLVLRFARIAPGEPIVLEGGEPVDPSTLYAEDFQLTRLKYEEQGSRVRPPLDDPIPVEVRLIENFDKYAPRPRGTTLIELVPQRLLEPGKHYFVRVDPRTLRLRDFSGNQVQVFNAKGGLALVIEVVEGQGAVFSPPSELVVSFMDTSLRTLEPVEGADGTAWWGDSGRVEVRWPAAAGRGTEGELSARGALESVDVHALRFEVPEGELCELPPGPGLAVVRAQGRLSVSGTLSRSGGGGGAPARLPVPEGLTNLSEWLAWARETELDLTVLIAGGDLVVQGRIQVDGPLLLVAGGRLRIHDEQHLTASSVEILGEGGQRVRYLRRGESEGDYVRFLPLELDVPEMNPLAAPLTFAVVSASLPPQGRAARWHLEPHVGGYPGSGSWRVRYIGETPEGRTPPVDDPSVLVDAPSLRLLIELEVQPGGRWDPPWIDFVEIGWDPGRER